ncbi:MAG: hypothetical protein WAN48_10430 [Actinomycetes bacterium]
MIIDCGTCPVQGSGCADCFVASFLAVPSVPSVPSVPVAPSTPSQLVNPARGTAQGDWRVHGGGLPPEGALLDADERRALEVLASAQLVPPMSVGPVAAGDLPSAGRVPGRVGVTDDTPSANRRAV